MNLDTVIANFTGSTSIINNVAANVASLNTLTSNMGSFGDKLPIMGSAGTGIAAMTSAAQTAAQSLINKLPIALPAMKAVHILEKKVTMAPGGMAGTNASASFASYFDVMPAIDSQVASLTSSMSSTLGALGADAASIAGVTGATPQARMASLAALMPNPTIPDPENPDETIPNPDYTTFMSTNSIAMTAISGKATGLVGAASGGVGAIAAQMAAADSAFSSGIGKLKALSFASFCAGSQPLAVRAVIDRDVVTANIPDPEDLRVVGRSATGWGGVQTRSKRQPVFDLADDGVTVAPKPVVDTVDRPTAASPAQLAAIEAQIDQVIAAGTTASRAADAASATVTAWMASVNYAAIKNNRDRSPEDKAAYDSLRATADARADSIEMRRQYALYEQSARELARLRNIRQYMQQTGPYPGNSDGPW